MKFWIASYPRSGNSFIRTILTDAFGVSSGSIYPDEEAVLASNPELAERIGHSEGLFSQPESDSRIGIKTHGLPDDNAPAIYVVRDGRAALVSYLHFLQAFVPTEEPTLARLIKGKHWPGSWSDHFRSWDPLNRPNTLLIRYEDMRANPGQACADISAFLNIPQIAEPTERLTELQKIDPKLFRAGDNAKNLEEMGQHLELFNSLHHEVMSICGYYPA